MFKRREAIDVKKDILEYNSSNGADDLSLSLLDDENDKHKVTVDEDFVGSPTSFEVVDPIKGSFVTYTIKGYDNEGQFEGARRYSDFFALRNALLTRMPGLYIPPISPKKMIGNKNDKFLSERKFFLQRFLQLSCRIDHIIKSQEFKIFSRPSGEIEKALELLPKMTPELLYERLTTEYEFKEEEDLVEIKENEAVINSYTVYIKKIIPTLKNIRDKVKPMVMSRGEHNENFQTMINLMSHYEQGALLQYVDSDPDKLIMGNSLNPLYIDTSTDIIDKFKNSFLDVYLWVKGEIYDVQALHDSIEGSNKLIKQKSKLEAKKKSNEETIDKVKNGKTTFKTIFSNDLKKDQLVTSTTNENEIIERDIELYEKIINVLQSHIAKDVVPNFKKQKIK